MTGYKIITIDSLIESIGEEALNAILSNYSCPMNTDIEDFLHNKAVTFSRFHFGDAAGSAAGFPSGSAGGAAGSS